MRGKLFLSLLAGILFTFVAFGVMVYRADSAAADTYRPAPATEIQADGNSPDVPYVYRVGDRLCRGTSISGLYPVDSPTVYYDSKDVCRSVTTDPAGTRIGHQLMLLFAAVYGVTFLWLGTLQTKQPKETTWQPH